MEPLTQKDKQKRKFLLMLPVLVIPFLIMIFWSLGGGKNADAQEVKPVTGLDMHLPDARHEENASDKLGFYQQADKDAAKLKDELRNDPYHKDSLQAMSGSVVDSERNMQIANSPYGGSNLATANHVDPNEEKVNRKLAELQAQLNSSPAQPTPPSYDAAAQQAQMQQMAAMMRTMNTSSAPDPEMQQLTGMLDKILYLEHPELAREEIRKQSLKNKKQAYIVSIAPANDRVQLMQGDELLTSTPTNARKRSARTIKESPMDQSSFYESSNMSNPANETGNAIEAEVAETRDIVSGATLKLRLLNDIYIHGTLIPKEQFIYGTCSVSGDRLLIALSSIQFHNSIYPVALAAYDLDGLNGINIPDAISRQVAKGSTGQAISGIELYSFDNTIKGQAASAGVEAAKSLFSKKTLLVKVTVKEGYRVLLHNTDEQ